jgi:hypothetical protein
MPSHTLLLSKIPFCNEPLTRYGFLTTVKSKGLFTLLITLMWTQPATDAKHKFLLKVGQLFVGIDKNDLLTDLNTQSYVSRGKR